MAATLTAVQMGSRTVDIGVASPAPQASTSSTVVVTGSDMDARPWRSVSYTLSAATNAVTWSVFGANRSDFTDEVVVQNAASVSAGANATYAVTQAPYAFYRVKIVDTVGGTHGTATVTGMLK
jgi:hypothetical protein